jgi:uncharacterized membrane protein YoaT (DUF817 family)
MGCKTLVKVVIGLFVAFAAAIAAFLGAYWWYFNRGA